MTSATTAARAGRECKCGRPGPVSVPPRRVLRSGDGLLGRRTGEVEWIARPLGKGSSRRGAPGRGSCVHTGSHVVSQHMERLDDRSCPSGGDTTEIGSLRKAVGMPGPQHRAVGAPQFVFRGVWLKAEQNARFEWCHRSFASPAASYGHVAIATPRSNNLEASAETLVSASYGGQHFLHSPGAECAPQRDTTRPAPRRSAVQRDGAQARWDAGSEEVFDADLSSWCVTNIDPSEYGEISTKVRSPGLSLDPSGARAYPQAASSTVTLTVQLKEATPAEARARTGNSR